MEKAHFAVLLCVAVFLTGLGLFALRIRPEGRGFRMVQRMFWGFFGAFLMQGAGVWGLNWVTFLVSAAFGVPGMAALLAIAQM